MSILLTPLYDAGQTKYDLLGYTIENNIQVSAVPGKMGGETGVIVIYTEDLEIISKFPHYPWVEYSGGTYKFFVDGEEVGEVLGEVPSVEDPTKEISVVLPDSECNLSFNSGALAVQIFQK